MKKAIGIAVLAALIVSLSGCANTNRPQTIQDSSGIEVVTNEVDERTEPEESSPASVSESKESSVDSTVEVKDETESTQAENSQPIAEQSPAIQTRPPQPIVPNDTPKTVEPTPEPKPSPTQQQPPAEEKPTPEPAPTEPPQETAPPDEPAVPEFNIQTWIDYAKAYAVNGSVQPGRGYYRCLDMGGETLRRELRSVYRLRLSKIKTEYFTMNALCKKHGAFFHFKEDFK